MESASANSLPHQTALSGELRKRLWTSAAAPIFGLVTFVLVMALGFFLAVAQKQDSVFETNSRQLVSNEISGTIKHLNNLAVDWALWDAAYQSITRRWDQDWVKETLLSDMTDLILVMRNGQARFVWVAEGIPDSRAIAAAVIARSLPATAAEPEAMSFQFQIGEMLAFVATHPVTPETGAGPLRDSIVIVRLLDGAKAQEIGERLGLEDFHIANDNHSVSEKDVVSLDISDTGFGWRHERPGSTAFSGFAIPSLIMVLIAGLIAWIVARDMFRGNVSARIEAERAAKAKSEFLAVMSHEIRTPMNGVLGMAQALSASGLNPAQQEMLKVIHDSGDTLMSLLDDILDMSKIEAGKIDLEQIAFDPAEIGEHVQHLFAQRAAAKGLQLKLHNQLPAGSWRLGDPTRIRQIITNLVSNGLKFTESGSVSLISTISPDTGALQITVIDTGIGIPEQQVSRLFSKFTQADSSHTRVYGGTGLGLAITKALIEAMGGTISITSKVDEGSCFSVLLPLPVAETPHEATDQVKVEGSTLVSHAQAEYADGDLQVLVAEDNMTNQQVLKLLLGQIGLRADFVCDGRAAFEAWQSKPYDLVLMDMQMPVWDGLTAMKAIRQAETESGRATVAIVSLTANAMTHQIAEQLAAGADAHAGKPIRMDELIPAMEAALEGAAQRGLDPASRSMAG